jgi:hypothetical protein
LSATSPVNSPAPAPAPAASPALVPAAWPATLTAPATSAATLTARALDLALLLDCAFDRATSLARCLDEVLQQARTAAIVLDDVGQAEEADRSDRSLAQGARAQPRQVVSSARRLVTVAAWLLPARERARYGKEDRSELHDLAHAGAGRHQQLRYAARLLVQAVPLCVAVLAPRRETASL